MSLGISKDVFSAHLIFKAVFVAFPSRLFLNTKYFFLTRRSPLRSPSFHRQCKSGKALTSGIETFGMASVPTEEQI